MYTLLLYKAKDGPRWKMKRKGRIVANSGEAYDRPSKLRRAVDRLLKDLFRKENVKIVDKVSAELSRSELEVGNP